MGESRRSRFIKRISSVGWGARESVQMLLGAVVSDIRDQVMQGGFDEGDMETVVAFHDRVENVWRETMATDPPMAPRAMVEALQKLYEGCQGPLVGCAVQLERAIEQAVMFEQMKKMRDTTDE